MEPPHGKGFTLLQATATKISMADLMCGCDNGEGAAKNPLTGAPCPGVGAKYCSFCDEANDYYDFERDGVCKHRPACTCANGFAVGRWADCSSQSEKCLFCDLDYFLDPVSLSCKAMNCPVGAPLANTIWDASLNWTSTANVSVAPGAAARLHCAPYMIRGIGTGG